MLGTGYAGYSKLLPVPIVLSYTPEEWDLMQRDPNAISSVHRETQNVRLVLETILLQQAIAVTGGLLVYIGDNQGSIACLNGMKGKGETLSVVKDLYQLAAATDVALEIHLEAQGL